MKNITGNIVPKGCPAPERCNPDNQVYTRPKDEPLGVGAWYCGVCKRDSLKIQVDSGDEAELTDREVASLESIRVYANKHPDTPIDIED